MSWEEHLPPEARVERGAAMSAWTTFRLGGPARAIVHCEEPNACAATVRALRAAGERFECVGGGSNLLVSDAGLDEIVVRYASDDLRLRPEGADLVVAGSSPLDALAAYAVDAGLDGWTFATGIPGTVAGALAGNAGAFGEQMADRLVRASLLDPDGAIREVPPAELGFGYRSSAIAERGAIVLEVRLRAWPGDRDRLRSERERIRKFRSERHPDWRTVPTAGSFFRNIEPTSAAVRRQAAGWYLERAGAKGLHVGGAGVFPKHANIIVKEKPSCTAQDVLLLSRWMAAAVKEKFGLSLVREVRLLGGFDAL
jgi:UDP-N-acetylmuramate dehydrogenase